MKVSPISTGKRIVGRLLASCDLKVSRLTAFNKQRLELEAIREELRAVRQELEASRRGFKTANRTGSLSREPGTGLSTEERAAIRAYEEAGRVPWSPGYSLYKRWFVTRAIQDESLLERFRVGGGLPAGHGWRLDERAVEFPWALAHLRDCGGRTLDAGSTLNHPWVLTHPIVSERSLVIYTLAPEEQHARANLSYVYGDLRSTCLRDGCMDAVVSISTLEHIGMDNTMLYTRDQTFRECDLTAYRQVVEEFRRMLVPGGVALITVPFGKHENHGWAQQFDRGGVQDLIDTFGGRVEALQFYRYLPDGWRAASAEECAACEYFNIHATPQFGPDMAAAARAVACMRLVRA